MQPFEDWFGRNAALRCFPTHEAGVAYYSAWSRGKHRAVKRELLRILSGPARLPAVNWLGFPALVAELDSLEDGPLKWTEEWTPEDFSAAWRPGVDADLLATDPDALEALVAEETLRFAILPMSSKPAELRSMVDLVLRAVSSRPVPFGTLLRAVTVGTMLDWAAPSSPSMAEFEPGVAAVPGLLPGLSSRLDALVSAWRAVSSGPAGPLTLRAVSRASSVAELDAALSRSGSDRNANLVTFLACRPPA
jgi:hypothetical protein